MGGGVGRNTEIRMTCYKGKAFCSGVAHRLAFPGCGFVGWGLAQPGKQEPVASASHDSAPTEGKIRMALGRGGALELWRGALVPGWGPESIWGIQGGGHRWGSVSWTSLLCRKRQPWPGALRFQPLTGVEGGRLLQARPCLRLVSLFCSHPCSRDTRPQGP